MRGSVGGRREDMTVRGGSAHADKDRAAVGAARIAAHVADSVPGYVFFGIVFYFCKLEKRIKAHDFTVMPRAASFMYILI